VQGVNYTCGSLSGVTDTSGKFTYSATECPSGITFSLGGFVLGIVEPTAINSDTKLTIQELAGKERDELGEIVVQNMAVLLQSLDTDGNPENGITITEEAKTALGTAGLTGNFWQVNQDVIDTALTALDTAGTIQGIKTQEEAMLHLYNHTASLITSTTSTVSLATLKTGQTKSYDVNGIEITNGSIKDDGYYASSGLGTTRAFTRDAIIGTVTDTVAKLMWQDDATLNNADNEKSWTNANNYCEALTLGTHEDWRLPTITELTSIVDFRADNSNSRIFEVFQNYQNLESYWSSTEYEEYWETHHWYIHSNGANNYDEDSESYPYFVRCVRTVE
jgi:hypothetical protein